MENSIEQRNKLFEDNQKLVWFVIHRHFGQYIGNEDVVQEGFLALWKATKSTDGAKGDFFCYAYSAIRNAIRRWCKNQNHSKELTNYDEVMKEILKLPEETPAEIAEAKEIFEQLSDLDKQIITARMQGFSLREIGKQTGMTGERVRQRIERLKPHFEGRFDK